jgi:outer membrane immunogenic protein
MNKIAIGLIAIVALIGTPALAEAAPAYSWAGCYVGVNGGYGWNNGSSGYQDVNSIADPINFIPAVPIIFMGIPFRPPLLAYLTTPSGTGGSGGLIGGSGGCNYQNQQWVAGFEADFDWAHISGTSNTSGNSGPGVYQLSQGVNTGINTVGTATEQVSLRWLSTLRARGGILLSDRLLLFATGGLALGGINSQGSVNLFDGAFGALSTIWSGSATSTRVGGVVGGGLEWALSDRTTLKAEYLWYNLGNVSHPLNCTFEDGPCGTDVFPSLGNTSSSVYGSIVRVGLNYRFNVRN